MTSVPLLDLKPQYAAIKEEVQSALNRVCDSQYFILGPEVEALEKELAAYCQTEFALGVSSGTDALLLAMMAIGVKPVQNDNDPQGGKRLFYALGQPMECFELTVLLAGR